MTPPKLDIVFRAKSIPDGKGQVQQTRIVLHPEMYTLAHAQRLVDYCLSHHAVLTVTTKQNTKFTIDTKRYNAISIMQELPEDFE